MSTTPSPFADPAYDILNGEPVLSDENRADLYDVFYNSKNPDELVQHLQSLAAPADSTKQPLVIPDDTKKRLYDAKQTMTPTPGPVDKIASVMNQMKQLDPTSLELAEAHPTVFKTLAAAATAPEKEAGGAEPSNGVKTPAKRPAGGSATQSKPLVLPPRPDGLEHLPPIGPNMKRVLASDGSIHDVPEENALKVFELDPRAHILNP